MSRELADRTWSTAVLVVKALGSAVFERRKDSLRRFASIFRQVAQAREGDWSTDLPRFHLRDNVSRADEELVAQIADAQAPFWRHVREALCAQQ